MAQLKLVFDTTLGKMLFVPDTGGGGGGMSVALGDHVLFPRQITDEIVEIDGMRFLRSGSWVMAADTALAGTAFESVDGQVAGTDLGVTVGIGQTIDENGDAFRGASSAGTIAYVRVTGQTAGPVIVPAGAVSLSGDNCYGFRLGAREFLVAEISGPQTNIYELVGGALVIRVGPLGTWNNTDIGAAWDGSIGLVVNPTGTNIRRTTDGGTAWAQVNLPQTTGLRQAGHNGNVFVVSRASGSQLFTSATAGTGSWTTRTLPSGNCTALLTLPGVILVGDDGGVIYRSTDDGASWTLVATLGGVGGVVYIHRDPLRGRLLAQRIGSVSQSTDDGATWTTTALNSFSISNPQQARSVPLLQTMGGAGSSQQLFGGAVGSAVQSVQSSAGPIYYMRIA